MSIIRTNFIVFWLYIVFLIFISTPKAFSESTISLGKQVGVLNEDVISASIIDLNSDGSYEIIYLLSYGIYIAPYKQVAKPIFFKFTGFGTPISFSVSPKDSLIAVNILIPNTGLESCILRFNGNTLQLIQDNINMWLNFLSDGTLIVQKYDAKKMFSNDFFVARISDSGLLFTDKKISIPADTIFNTLAFADLNQNDLKEIIFLNKEGYITVYESDKIVFLRKITEKIQQFSFLNTRVAVEPKEKNVWFLVANQDRQNTDAVSLFQLSFSSDYIIKSVSIKINGDIVGFDFVGDKLILILKNRTMDSSGQIHTKIYEIADFHI